MSATRGLLIRVAVPSRQATKILKHFALTFSMAPLLLVVCLMSGCGGSSVEIPKPTDSLKPPPSPPPVEQSVVHLEVSVPIDELTIAADAAVPRDAGQEETWQDGGMLTDGGTFHYQHRFVRDELHLRVVENRVEMYFPDIQYRLALRMTRPGGDVLEGRCGYGDDPPKRLRLTANSLLSWTDGWTLKSDTSFDQPEFLDPCRLTDVGVDATPILKSMIDTRLRSLAGSIDAKVRERSEAKQRAKMIWQKLQEPVELGANLWLDLNPIAARVSPISSENDQTIRTSVNLILEPMAHVGSKPPVRHRSMPPLELTPLSQEGFHLAVPILAEFSVINRRLEQRLVGQTIATSTGEPLKIISAQMYGSGRNLILDLGVTGAVNGHLYATGQPFYDTVMESLRFKQLDFTVDTESMLVRVADRLFHDDVLFRLKAQADIDLSGPIAGLRQRLSERLTREVSPGMWLEGRVTDLQPRGIYPVPDGVEVLLVIDGSLELFVR